MTKNFTFSPRSNEDGNDDRGHNHDASKHYKTHSEEQFLELSYLTDGLIHRSIESNDNGTKL